MIKHLLVFDLVDLLLLKQVNMRPHKTHKSVKLFLFLTYSLQNQTSSSFSEFIS